MMQTSLTTAVPPHLSHATNTRKNTVSTSTRLNRRLAAPALLLCALLLTACSEKEAKPEPVRPVRAAVLTEGAAGASADFSGEVRPRIESRLGFRVPGKIVARLVDVGATVKKGQVLARLDPTDLALAQQSAQAQLSAAKTDRDLAAADLKRYSELFAKGFISAAEQQRHQANYDAAQAPAATTAASIERPPDRSRRVRRLPARGVRLPARWSRGGVRAPETIRCSTRRCRAVPLCRRSNRRGSREGRSGEV